MKVKLTCDWCGQEFEREKRDLGHHNKHFYCSKECAREGTHAPRSPQKITWLSAADTPEEVYLLEQILDRAVRMKKVRFGTLEWERLDAAHSALIDVAAGVFRMHGKRVGEKQHGESGYSYDS